MGKSDIMDLPNSDREIAMEEKITLFLDDGTELECQILTIFEANGQDYIALFPLAPEYEESGQVFIYRYSEDENNRSLIISSMMKNTTLWRKHLMNGWTPANMTRSSAGRNWISTIETGFSWKRFSKESGRLQLIVFVLNVQKLQLLFCPRHGYIKQPPLFFKVFNDPHPAVGRNAFIYIQDQNMIKFQPL